MDLGWLDAFLTADLGEIYLWNIPLPNVLSRTFKNKRPRISRHWWKFVVFPFHQQNEILIVRLLSPSPCSDTFPWIERIAVGICWYIWLFHVADCESRWFKTTGNLFLNTFFLFEPFLYFKGHINGSSKAVSAPGHVCKDHVYWSVYLKATCRCNVMISWECCPEKKSHPVPPKWKRKEFLLESGSCVLTFM